MNTGHSHSMATTADNLPKMPGAGTSRMVDEAFKKWLKRTGQEPDRTFASHRKTWNRSYVKDTKPK